MALSQQDTNRIANARPDQIIAALTRLGGVTSLAPGNQYANCEVADQAAYNAAESLDAIDLTAIAASNHGLDGWSFLARSISSLMAGDAHAARHFAYYAELRAALGLLAAGGIGVFNRVNFSIDQAGTLARLNRSGTHVMVWDALDAWVSSGEAPTIFANSLTVAQVNLQDCLDVLFPTAIGGHRQVATALTTAWGFDLLQGVDDKKTRNNSSYDPQTLHPLSVSIDSGLSFIDEFWEAFEPSGIDRFDAIDRHILRAAVEFERQSLGITDRLSESHYENLDESVKKIASRDFLDRLVEPDDHRLIGLARSKSNPAHPLEMISRAALLLRLASAVTRRHLVDAGLFDRATIGAWLANYAIGRAVIRDASLPESPADLWDDIEVSRDALEALRKTLAASELDLTRWHVSSEMTFSLPRVCEAERVAVWSLLPPEP